MGLHIIKYGFDLECKVPFKMQSIHVVDNQVGNINMARAPKSRCSVPNICVLRHKNEETTEDILINFEFVIQV